MWRERRQTLPSLRRGSTTTKVKRVSLYERHSLIKIPENFEDDIPGIHDPGEGRDFQIPTKPRGVGEKMVKLDALRLLNMGHINERYHQDYFHPPKRGSVLQELEAEAKSEEPIFPVRHIVKAARQSVREVKTGHTQDLVIDRPERRSGSTISTNPEEFDSGSVQGGFFTVDQGIGQGRVNSPRHQRKWYLMLNDLDEDPIYNLSLVKQAGLKSTDDIELPEPDSVFTPIQKRLNIRAGKAKHWADSVNPKSAGGVLKSAPARGVADAQRKAAKELALGIQHTEEKVWPMNQFLRMTAPKELRVVERITPEQQKKNLQKGLGIGATIQKLDFGTKAESLRRQLDPAKWKEEGRMYLCKGVLHDNAQEYAESVAMYEKYLDICERLDDKEGQALAHNFIACSIQEKEDIKLELIKSQAQKSKAMTSSSGKDTVPESSVAEYERALYHNMKAAEYCGVEGLFICYTNLGLLCSTLSMWAKAAKNHKKALKCATVLEDARGQCAAVGNMGYLLYRRKKFEAARTCMTRYLEICKVINYMSGIAKAHFILGDIETQFKRYKAAQAEYENGLTAAKECGDIQLQTSCRVQIGVCKATLQLNE